MDLAKLIDKFFGYLSGLVPGTVVLLIAALHRPEAWSDFWKVNYLGYQTKIAILFVFALIAGSTVNSVLGAIIGGISNGVAGSQAEKRAALAAQAQQQYPSAGPPPAPTNAWEAAPQELASAGPPTLPPEDRPLPDGAPSAAPAPVAQVAAVSQEVAYWRDVNWRNMVAAYLGKAAPENLQPFYDQAELDNAMAIAQSLPQPEQGRELARIARRTSPAQLQVNDELWRECWFRMNGVMGRANDPQMKQALILVSAYGGASILLLLAAPFTPALRHWWILLPCVYYVFVTTGQAIMGYAKSQDPAQLFDQQWQYLQTHVGKGEQVSE